MLLVLGACSFDASGLPSTDDASDLDGNAPPVVDASGDAVVGADDASFVCSTTSLMCPGNQPLRLLSCGEPSDCWVGCRDGDVVSVDQAAAFCQSWGGRLGRINSAAEETCVRTVINGAVILGLVQAANQSDPDVGWSWNGDGIAPPYLNWGNGQPNDGTAGENNEEQCSYSNSGVEWHDVVCDAPTSARFTCRYP
jgi:hypothetical protein